MSTEMVDSHEVTTVDLDEPHHAGNGSSVVEAGGDLRGLKRPRPVVADADDDDYEKLGRERRKIEIKFIDDKTRRHITFSKRKHGIMKKAYELSVLTGTQVLLLVVSETGLVYTFTTPKLQPLVIKAEGKNLIQACLNAPEPAVSNENGVDEGPDSPDDTTSTHQHHHSLQQQQQHQQHHQHHQQHHQQQQNPQQQQHQQQTQQQTQQLLQSQASRAAIVPPSMGASYLPMDSSQLAYQGYVQQRSAQYGLAPQAGMPQHTARQS